LTRGQDVRVEGRRGQVRVLTKTTGYGTLYWIEIQGTPDFAAWEHAYDAVAAYVRCITGLSMACASPKHPCTWKVLNPGKMLPAPFVPQNDMKLGDTYVARPVGPHGRTKKESFISRLAGSIACTTR